MSKRAMQHRVPPFATGELDVEKDSPELEAELLKAVNGPHAPLGENELQEIAARARKTHIRNFSH